LLKITPDEGLRHSRILARNPDGSAASRTRNYPRLTRGSVCPKRQHQTCPKRARPRLRARPHRTSPKSRAIDHAEREKKNNGHGNANRNNGTCQSLRPQATGPATALHPHHYATATAKSASDLAYDPRASAEDDGTSRLRAPGDARLKPVSAPPRAPARGRPPPGPVRASAPPPPAPRRLLLALTLPPARVCECRTQKRPSCRPARLSGA
jgi:hypothetical protein